MARHEKYARFLRDSIADALIELMKEKNFDDIRIEEITKKADVGRTTYFRGFSSKKDVLTYKIIRLWEINAEERNLAVRDRFDIRNALDFFEINYSFKDVLSLLYAQKQEDALLNAFYRIMLPNTLENKDILYRESFYSAGLFGLLDRWIKDGYQKSPKEMAEILKSAVVVRDDSDRP